MTYYYRTNFYIDLYRDILFFNKIYNIIITVVWSPLPIIDLVDNLCQSLFHFIEVDFLNRQFKDERLIISVDMVLCFYTFHVYMFHVWICWVISKTKLKEYHYCLCIWYMLMILFIHISSDELDSVI